MILSYTDKTFNIPRTSSCVIHTKGVLNNGDIVEVTSPLFTSIDYTVKTIHLTKTLSVPIRLETQVEGTGELIGELLCDDNDICNMYVNYHV